MALTKIQGSGISGGVNLKAINGGYTGGLSIEDDSNTTKSAITHVVGTMAISANASADHMLITADGEVTMPLQPAFLAGPSANINNAANGTVITLGTEIFDVGGNVASNNFVAPVTGKYFLSFSIRMQEVDDGTSYLYIRILTSNREFIYIFAPNVFDQDADFWSVSQSGIFDMDANDSAALTFHYVNGNQSVDIRDITNGTYFSGALIC